MTHPARYHVAAALAAALALYVTVFARQTHDLFDRPTFIDLTEWPATLFCLAAAGAALARRAAPSAVAIVSGLIAFFAAQYAWIFEVPLAFVLSTLVVFLTLYVLPPDTSR